MVFNLDHCAPGRFLHRLCASTPVWFYDPSLMKIMRWGLMLSLAGFLFAVGGAWRKSSLRWHAPVCAFGTFAFWILAAERE
jgi:hypothetical protein